MFQGRLWELFVESFPKILIPGLTVTIPLTAIAFSLALVIAVITALVQFAEVKVLRRVARFYIWIFRGTPLLVQLFIVFYGLSRVGIVLAPFPAAVIVFSLNEGATAPRPSAPRWNPSRRDSWRQVSAPDFRTYRPYSGSFCRRRCARRFRRCQIRSLRWSRTRRWPRTSPSPRCSW